MYNILSHTVTFTISRRVEMADWYKRQVAKEAFERGKRGKGPRGILDSIAEEAAGISTPDTENAAIEANIRGKAARDIADTVKESREREDSSSYSGGSNVSSPYHGFVDNTSWPLVLLTAALVYWRFTLFIIGLLFFVGLMSLAALSLVLTAIFEPERLNPTQNSKTSNVVPVTPDPAITPRPTVKPVKPPVTLPLRYEQDWGPFPSKQRLSLMRLGYPGALLTVKAVELGLDKATIDVVFTTAETYPEAWILRPDLVRAELLDDRGHGHRLLEQDYGVNWVPVPHDLSQFGYRLSSGERLKLTLVFSTVPRVTGLQTLYLPQFGNMWLPLTRKLI
jgi:hypothetical protein